MTIEEILATEEGQVFERKSIKIDPKALSEPICAFANADGGILAVGITNTKRDVEGVDFNIEKLNEILRVPLDYCNPSIAVMTEMVPCTDMDGRENHVLLINIEPSIQVHANQADEVFMCVGDKSKKLPFEDRITLMYDKGMRSYEDIPVADAEQDDIDIELVKDYIQRIKYGKSPMEYLKENKGFVKDKNGQLQISTAAILLFGKHPQTYFPRARVRFIRYDGISEKFGTEMNVIKDVIFEGAILQQVNETIKYLNTQIKEKTYLGSDGLFRTDEEYPEFVREEIIVNAITHRDYSIKGTDIQIKMFDDRILVESPGKLPGLVKPDNIRYTHFSRNPKIAEFLKAFKYVKEYGEGVNRMYVEMEKAGLPAPRYHRQSFMLETIIRNDYQKSNIQKQNSEIATEKSEIQEQNSEIEAEKSEIRLQKIQIVSLIEKMESRNYKVTTKEKLKTIYYVMEMNQVFSTKDIVKIFDCADSTASALMDRLRDMNVVVEVKGVGKGKVRFVLENEVQGCCD